jgi:hypothetical protein
MCRFKVLASVAVEVFVLIVIIALLGFIGFSIYHKESVEMPESYQSWVKQTGNPKSLTYEEWRSLVRVKQDQEPAPVIVPIIIPQ